MSLLDPLGQMELLDDEFGGRMSGAGLSIDEGMKAFAGGFERIRFIRDAHPKSWARFEKEICTADELASFSAFLHFLDFADQFAGHQLVFDRDGLLRCVAVFNKAYPEMRLDDPTFFRLIEIFSLDPQSAHDWLLPVPFLRISDRFLRFDGFNQILGGTIGLLTIAIRKNEKIWSETVGSTLAFAADALARTLPSFNHVAVATRRKIHGKGDIDLAVYDTVKRHLFVCEVKTVYDKHRTPLHMHRFEDAKVKLQHAVEQLRESRIAVEEKRITMHDLFGKKLPAPLKVTSVLLTWFDPVDLTVATEDEDILSMNFASFRFLLRASEGDLDVFHVAANELRNIWCLSSTRPIDLQTDVPAFIEEPIVLLDRMTDLNALELSQLTQTILALLPCRPEDPWDPEETLVSYLSDTRTSLTQAT